MESVLKSQSAVPKSGLRDTRRGLSKQRVCVPANFQIARCGKLEQSYQVVFALFLWSHHMVVSVLNFQDSILRNVCWVCHGRAVWVGDDSILWRIRALRESIGWKEAEERLRQNDGKDVMTK